ncbi:hypothetical protein [Bradyrhizobium sp. UFLA05-112]
MSGWKRPFDDPIALPNGTQLPKREHDAPEWLVAIEALMLVAEKGGPTMFCPHRIQARVESRE